MQKPRSLPATVRFLNPSLRHSLNAETLLTVIDSFLYPLVNTSHFLLT